MPDRVRVALAGVASDDPAAARIASVATVVPLDAAELVVRVTGGRDALAVIADGFALPTIVLLDDPHAEISAAALRAGAAGVVARDADEDELRAAFAAVRAGFVVLDRAVRDAFAPAATALDGALREPPTQREREVLAMLASGLSNRRIAARLAISENTVKAHVAALLAKLGATSRTEAVAIGIRLGLVTL